MPFSIEVVFPEWIFIVIGHIISFAIDAFERVGVWQALSSFEARGIKFRVSFITLC